MADAAKTGVEAPVGFTGAISIRLVPKITVDIPLPSIRSLVGLRTGIPISGTGDYLEGIPDSKGAFTPVPVGLTWKVFNDARVIGVPEEREIRQSAQIKMDPGQGPRKFSIVFPDGKDPYLDALEHHLFNRGKVGLKIEIDFPYLEPKEFAPWIEFDFPARLQISPEGPYKMGQILNLAPVLHAIFAEAALKLRVSEDDSEDGEIASDRDFSADLSWAPKDRTPLDWRIGCAFTSGPPYLSYAEAAEIGGFEFALQLILLAKEGDKPIELPRSPLIKVAKPKLTGFSLDALTVRERSGSAEATLIPQGTGSIEGIDPRMPLSVEIELFAIYKSGFILNLHQHAHSAVENGRFQFSFPPIEIQMMAVLRSREAVLFTTLNLGSGTADPGTPFEQLFETDSFRNPRIQFIQTSSQANLDGIGGRICSNGVAITGATVPLLKEPLLIYADKVSRLFKLRLFDICHDLDINPDFLMACMMFETGGTMRADQENLAYKAQGREGAIGLIQFMPVTAKGLGTTTAALKAMKPEDQLLFVGKYFKPNAGRLHTLEDVYMAILWPNAISKPPTYPLFKEGSKSYADNPMDWNKDGAVTKAEATQKVRRIYEEGKGSLG